MIHKDVTLTDWNAITRALVVECNADFADFTYGTYGGHHPHKSRAVDAFVPNYRTTAGKARGWVLAKWVWSNRVRLGVWYVIFDGKIISQSNPGLGWVGYRPSADAIKRSPDIAYHRDHVHVSTYLTVQQPAKTGTYTVRAGDTLARVAAQVGLGNWQELAALNPDIDPDRLRVGQTIKIPTPQQAPTSTYTVQAGDTLTKIAKSFGLRWQDLAKLNPSIDPNALRVGQVLIVPKQEQPVRIRVTSTNMLDDTLASAKAHPWSKRKAGYIDCVKSTDPDVILIQEATKAQVADVCAALGASWTWWRAADTARDDGPVAVAWDTAVLERVDVSEVELPSNRRGLAVHLEHEESGRKFWAVCSHLDNGAAAAATRDEQAGKLAGWLPAGPLVFGADLNDARTGTAGPRATLRKAGLTFVRDAVNVDGDEWESHHGFGSLTKDGKWIDDAAARGVRIVEAALVRTDRGAPTKLHRSVTDHNMIRLVVEL